jgi:hypothetical protein
MIKAAAENIKNNKKLLKSSPETLLERMRDRKYLKK